MGSVVVAVLLLGFLAFLVVGLGVALAWLDVEAERVGSIEGQPDPAERARRVERRLDTEAYLHQRALRGRPG